MTPKKVSAQAPITFLDIAKMHEHLVNMDRDTAVALNEIVKVLQPLPKDMQQAAIKALNDIVY